MNTASTVRNESSLLKDLGKLFEMFRKIINAVLDRGGDDSHIMRILREPDLVNKIADLIRFRYIDCSRAEKTSHNFAAPPHIHSVGLRPVEHESIQFRVEYRDLYISDMAIYRPDRPLTIRDVLNARHVHNDSVCGEELYTTYFAGGPVADFFFKNPELFPAKSLNFVGDGDLILFLGTIYRDPRGNCYVEVAACHSDGSFRRDFIADNKVFDHNMAIMAIRPNGQSDRFHQQKIVH